MSRLHNRILIPVLLVAVVVLAIMSDVVAPLDRIAWRVSTFNSASSEASLSIPQTHRVPMVLPKDVSIEFTVRPSDDHYTNIFQTSDGNRGIRMELTHPNQLHLVLSEDLYLLIDRNFDLNRWHHVRIDVKDSGYVDVQLENAKPIEIAPMSGAIRRYQIDNIVVGSGYTRSRNFQGEIRDFAISAQIEGRHALLDVVTAALGLILFFLHFRRVKRPDAELVAPYRFGDASVLFLLIIFLIAVGRVVGNHEPFLGKWYQMIVVGVVVLFPIVKLARQQFFLRYLTQLAALVIAAAILWLALRFHVDIASYPRSIFSVSLVLFAAAALVKFVRRQRPGHQKSSLFDTYVGATLFPVALFGLMVVGLVETPNWTAFTYVLALRPATTAVLAAIALTMSLHFLIVAAEIRAVGTRSVVRNVGRVVVLTIPYLVFFILAFRADSLFIPGSEYHWEYFVGPLRTVRDGGLLLWDTPSQYGYLNILLSATIPVTNSWQAFYIFQGILFFVVAVLFYRTLSRVTGINKLFLFLLVSCGLFFADPEQIGPYPFPSSSVVRFFWCYILITVGVWCLRERRWDMHKWMVFGGIAWGLAVVWSAESAIYSTTMFFAPIVASLIYQRHENNFPYKLLTVPVLWLMFLLMLISVSMWQTVGHLPDWRMLVEHGLSYAGGFGAMPVTYWGSGWVLLVAFFALSVVFYTRRHAPEGMLAALLVGCIWAVASYFIGRAVPNNITAILPLIVFTLAIAIGLADESVTRLVRIVSFPVFVIVLITGLFTPKFFETITKLSAFDLNIDQHIQSTSPELEQLMARAGVHPDSAIAYYGFAAAMPRDSVSQRLFEHGWLPAPLQLLEEPISKRRRLTVIQRFLARRRAEGYFIQAKGENEERAKEWREILAGYYETTASYDSQNYRIVHYRPRLLP